MTQVLDTHWMDTLCRMEQQGQGEEAPSGIVKRVFEKVLLPYTCSLIAGASPFVIEHMEDIEDILGMFSAHNVDTRALKVSRGYRGVKMIRGEVHH